MKNSGRQEKPQTKFWRACLQFQSFQTFPTFAKNTFHPHLHIWRGCLVRIKQDLCSNSISPLLVFSTVASFPWSCRYICYNFDPGNILLVRLPKPLAPGSDISWGTWQYLTSSPHYFLDPGNISWTVLVISLILAIFLELFLSCPWSRWYFLNQGKLRLLLTPIRPPTSYAHAGKPCHRHILCSVFLCFLTDHIL